MSKLFSHQIRCKNFDYRTSVDFDDVAIAIGADIGRLELLSERKDVNLPDWEVLKIKIEVHPQNNEINIFCDEKLVGEMHIDNLDADELDIINNKYADTDPEREVKILEELYERISDGDVEKNIAEQVIERFPTDPIIGCLIKCATSTILGQVIRCWYNVWEIEQIRNKLISFGKCMVNESWGMVKTFVWRSGWCVGRLGL